MITRIPWLVFCYWFSLLIFCLLFPKAWWQSPSLEHLDGDSLDRSVGDDEDGSAIKKRKRRTEAGPIMVRWMAVEGAPTSLRTRHGFECGVGPDFYTNMLPTTYVGGEGKGNQTRIE